MVHVLVKVLVLVHGLLLVRLVIWELLILHLVWHLILHLVTHLLIEVLVLLELLLLVLVELLLLLLRHLVHIEVVWCKTSILLDLLRLIVLLHDWLFFDWSILSLLASRFGLVHLLRLRRLSRRVR